MFYCKYGEASVDQQRRGFQYGSIPSEQQIRSCTGVMVTQNRKKEGRMDPRCICVSHSHRPGSRDPEGMLFITAGTGAG